MDSGIDLDVAIIGGGIAGLALAHRLRVDAPWLRIRLYEASDRLGGKILTERVTTDHGDFLVEAGPDAYLTQKPWARALATELGLVGEIIPINPVPQPVAILKQGSLVPLPAGLRLIVPTDLSAFLTSPLLEPGERLRALAEIALPGRRSQGDETLASFVRRRFGQGYLEQIAESLASGIYNADPARMGLQATFPNLLETERAERSLILTGRRNRPKASPGTAAPFESFRGGMQALPDKLAAVVGDVARMRTTIHRLERELNGGFRLIGSRGMAVCARNVVVTTAAAETAELVSTIAPVSAIGLRRLQAVAAGSISLAIPASACSKEITGYGVVIPAREQQPFNAVTITSRKFAQRAPAGWHLVRLFFGGFRSPQTMALDDDALTASATDLLTDILGFLGTPLVVRIHRWSAGSPQYDLDHFGRVAAIRRHLPPGLQVIGSAFDGVGIPDLINTATRVAVELIENPGFNTEQRRYASQSA